MKSLKFLLQIAILLISSLTFAQESKTIYYSYVVYDIDLAGTSGGCRDALGLYIVSPIISGNRDSIISKRKKIKNDLERNWKNYVQEKRGWSISENCVKGREFEKSCYSGESRSLAQKSRARWLDHDGRYKHYSVGLEMSDFEGLEKPSSIKTNKLYFQNLMVGDMRLDGFVTVKNKFSFMNGPRVVSSYEDLTITKIDYDGELYTQTLNNAKKYLPLPYVSQVKPHLSVDYYIWTPKIVNAKPLRKEEHVIFTFPIERLVTVSDHYQNTEANRYFKNFNHENKPDSFFWINSILQHPKEDVGNDLMVGKVTKISEALIQELKAKLEKYKYEKERDFWGNKKKSKETKKKKDDDFWNN